MRTSLSHQHPEMLPLILAQQKITTNDPPANVINLRLQRRILPRCDPASAVVPAHNAPFYLLRSTRQGFFTKSLAFYNSVSPIQSQERPAPTHCCLLPAMTPLDALSCQMSRSTRHFTISSSGMESASRHVRKYVAPGCCQCGSFPPVLPTSTNSLKNRIGDETECPVGHRKRKRSRVLQNASPGAIGSQLALWRARLRIVALVHICPPTAVHETAKPTHPIGFCSSPRYRRNNLRISQHFSEEDALENPTLERHLK